MFFYIQNKKQNFINFVVDIHTIGGYSINQEVNIMTTEQKQIQTPKHDNQDNDLLIKRLKRIEGQIRGIQQMVENDRYCVDILIQITAAQSALKNVGFQLTERHMKHCVHDAMAKGDGDESVEELMAVLKQFSK